MKVKEVKSAHIPNSLWFVKENDFIAYQILHTDRLGRSCFVYLTIEGMNEIGRDYRNYSRRYSKTFIPFGIYLSLLIEMIQGYESWRWQRYAPTEEKTDLGESITTTLYFNELRLLHDEQLTKFYEERPRLNEP